MARSTVEQFRTFRRRCFVALSIEVCTLIVAPVVAVAVMIIFGESNLTKIVAAISLLLVFIVGQLIRHLYFRCPVCGRALPRGQRHVQFKALFNGHCNHCETDFKPLI